MGFYSKEYFLNESKVGDQMLEPDYRYARQEQPRQNNQQNNEDELERLNKQPADYGYTKDERKMLSKEERQERK